MKKLLAVLMMSMSFFVAQAGYTQSLYSDGNYSSSSGLGTETDVGTESVMTWVFGVMTFISFILALNAAWSDFEDWLKDNEGSDEPDLFDPRIQAVCTFYYKYKNDYDLDGMEDALRDNDYCSKP